jgi:hypothetical protein
LERGGIFLPEGLTKNDYERKRREELRTRERRREDSSLIEGRETNESCHLILRNGIKRLLSCDVHFYFILKYFFFSLLSLLMRTTRENEHSHQNKRDSSRRTREERSCKCFRGN